MNIHGSPYDRGSADSYYRRGKNPHWWPNGTHNHPLVMEGFMTSKEIKDYNQGYDDNERNYHFKDWGDDY